MLQFTKNDVVQLLLDNYSVEDEKLILNENVCMSIINSSLTYEELGYAFQNFVEDITETIGSTLSFDDFKDKSVEKMTMEIIDKMKKRKNEKI